MTFPALKTILLSPRSVQLASRYVSTALVAWGSINAQRSAGVIAILVPIALAVILAALDHFLHRTKTGKAICAEVATLITDPAVTVALDALAAQASDTAAKVDAIHAATVLTVSVPAASAAQTLRIQT